MKRKIIEIDRELCDGCGLCINACHEGAIALVDGKAQLVSEVYCDGLGACIGDCPRDAIRIVERDAEAFDEAAVARHLSGQSKPLVGIQASPATPAHGHGHQHQHGHAHHHQGGGGCPGSLARTLQPKTVQAQPSAAAVDSALANWPVQLELAPLRAPYFDHATLLVAADCVPFAFANFHGELLPGRCLLIGCPKLDEADFYAEKLTEILRGNAIDAIEVAFMEVPCCRGLVQLVQQAIAKSGRSLPLRLVQIGIRGEKLRDVQV